MIDWIITLIFPVISGLVGLYLVSKSVYNNFGKKGLIYLALFFILVTLGLKVMGTFDFNEPTKSSPGHFFFR